MFQKTDVVTLIDLTSLNNDDTNTNIISLSKKASTPIGNVAAICIFKEFIKTAKPLLAKDIKIATVINFPNGSFNLASTLEELNLALDNQADEIDLVMPYQLIMENKYKEVEDFVTTIKKHCGNKTLKVIIESGILAKEPLIKIASKISINAGADFIKTSTGKVTINATLEATKYMLEEIKASNSKCGFKAAGGIKTFEEALAYLNLTESIMGKAFIKAKTFRFGASSLLDNLLTNEKNNSTY